MGKELVINRVWAMPSRWTFTIKPIAELLDEEVYGVSVDPFAGQSELATHRNDLETDHPNKLDALDWLKTLPDNFADTVLYDPPYSITQAAKYNAKFASKAYWSACKKELARILKPGGTAISFGWNSGGLGKVNGLEVKRILLVPHGGNRNDTIVTVETRPKPLKETPKNALGNQRRV